MNNDMILESTIVSAEVNEYGDAIVFCRMCHPSPALMDVSEFYVAGAPKNFDACVGTKIRGTGRDIWIGDEIWLRRIRGKGDDGKVLDIEGLFKVPAKPLKPSLAALSTLRLLQQSEQLLAFLDHAPLREASLYDLTVWTDWEPWQVNAAAALLINVELADLTLGVRNRCEHRIVRLRSSPLAASVYATHGDDDFRSEDREGSPL